MTRHNKIPREGTFRRTDLLASYPPTGSIVILIYNWHIKLQEWEYRQIHIHADVEQTKSVDAIFYFICNIFLTYFENKSVHIMTEDN